MKTIVIHLDEHDDLISVRDKMVWSKSQRILLVWPEEGRPMLRCKFDLVSLQRHAYSLGAQLGLATRDPDVTALAHELGISIFRTEKQSQRQRWNRTRARRKFRNRQDQIDAIELRSALRERKMPAYLLGWRRLLVFTAGVMAVLAMGIYLLPGATIVIEPVQSDQRINMTVIADPLIISPGLSGAIPARKVSTIVEVQGEIKTSGTTRLSDQKASGAVQITNLTDMVLVIHSGATLLAEGSSQIQFAIQREVELLPGSGQSVIVPVKAIRGGVQGNLPADTLFSLEGPMGPNVLITNPAAFTGGTDLNLPAVSKKDYEKLRQQLMAMLLERAESDLSASLGDDQQLLSNSLQLDHILEETALPEVGEAGDVLRLNLRAEYSGFSVAEQDLEQLAEIALNANLPARQRAVPDSLIIEFNGEPRLLSNGRIECQVTASRKVIPDLSRQTVLKAVIGKRPAEAASQLTSLLNLERAPRITLTPSWWFWLPSLDFRIQIEGL